MTLWVCFWREDLQPRQMSKGAVTGENLWPLSQCWSGAGRGTQRPSQLEYHNETPLTSSLTQQALIFSQLWRLGVGDQGLAGSVSAEDSSWPAGGLLLTGPSCGRESKPNLSSGISPKKDTNPIKFWPHP